MLVFSLFVALFTIPTAVNAKDTFSQIGITQTNDEIYAQLKTIVQGAVDEYCPYVGSNGENSCVEGFDPVEPAKSLNSKLLWKAGQGYNHLTGSVLMPALIMTPGDTTFTSNTGHEYIVPQQVTLTAGQQNGTFSIAEGSILSDPQEFVNGFLSFPTNPNRWLSWQSGFATPVDLNLLTNYMVMFANEGQVAFMQSSNLAYTVTVKDYSNQQYMRSQLNYYAAQAMELLEKGCTDINVCPDVFELFWSTWGSGIAMKSLWGGLYQLMHNLRPCMISDANGGKGLNRESLSQCRIADIPAPLRTGQPVPDESTLNYYRSRRQFLNQEWRGSKIDTVNDPQLQEWINSIQDAPALLQVEVLLYWESFTTNPQLQQSFVTLRNRKTQEQQDIIRNALQPGATNAKDHPLAYGYATTTCYSGSCTNYRAEGNFYMSGVAECPSSNPCTFFINSLHACVPCKPGYTCWCLYPMYARPDWNLLQAAATTTVTNAGWTPVCMQASHAANNNGLHFAQSTVVCTGGFRTSVFPIQDYNSQVTCAPF